MIELYRNPVLEQVIVKTVAGFLNGHGGTLLIGDPGSRIRRLRLPNKLPEWLSPIPAIVPAQLFCYHLTQAKGFDTEGPRGLTKVTMTW